MHSMAVVLEAPGELSLQSLPLDTLGPADVLIGVDYSGISTGTERLLWSGRMPPFPGLGYPLVPGYESVGTVLAAGADSALAAGATVFVPGARCFGAVRGLFGGAASHLVTPASRVQPIDAGLGEQGVLLALAATAWHAIRAPGAALPELIVGHGVLGRLLARLTRALGGAVTVWETCTERMGAADYPVLRPEDDPRHDYRCIVDVSGDDSVLDTLLARIAHGGEIVLAGFYAGTVGFQFPVAFRREARLRVAAEWQPGDLAAVLALVDSGRLSLDQLVTHREPAQAAASAYRTAFGDPLCLKMILDWRAHA